MSATEKDLLERLQTKTLACLALVRLVENLEREIARLHDIIDAMAKQILFPPPGTTQETRRLPDWMDGSDE